MVVERDAAFGCGAGDGRGQGYGYAGEDLSQCTSRTQVFAEPDGSWTPMLTLSADQGLLDDSDTVYASFADSVHLVAIIMLIRKLPGAMRLPDAIAFG